MLQVSLRNTQMASRTGVCRTEAPPVNRQEACEQLCRYPAPHPDPSSSTHDLVTALYCQVGCLADAQKPGKVFNQKGAHEAKLENPYRSLLAKVSMKPLNLRLIRTQGCYRVSYILRTQGNRARCGVKD